MNKEHYNELVLLSQEIYDQAAEKLTDYCAAKYCGIGNDTMEQQLEDYLFVAEETSVGERSQTDAARIAFHSFPRIRRHNARTGKNEAIPIAIPTRRQASTPRGDIATKRRNSRFLTGRNKPKTSEPNRAPVEESPRTKTSS